VTLQTAERAASVSIVVPTYGRPELLARCLHALAELDYPAERYEIVVVDDGSDEPDASRIAWTCMQGGARLERQARSGPAAARNRGARVARGEYVAFLDDDCAPSPAWLSLLAARLREAPDSAVGGRTVNVGPLSLTAVANQLHADYLQGPLVDRGAPPRFVASNNFAVSAELFRSLGGFDESFRLAGSEDRDLCDRWASAGHPLLIEPGAVVLHCHPLGVAGFLRKHFEYGRGAFRFRRAHGRRHADRIRLEPPRFYAGLVVAPFRHGRGPRSALLAALLVLSQLANAAGFFVEAVNGRPRADRS
jgi:GT2 family glycosyltransferase